MQRSHLAKDILDSLKACMLAQWPAGRCEQFQFGRSRGIAPADCDSITISFIDETADDFADCKVIGRSCEEPWIETTRLRIILTEVCMGPDQKPMFDWALEDEVAACFSDDFDLLKKCVRCTDWETLVSDHNLNTFQMSSISYDVESEGGGYSAYIEITATSNECC